MGEKKTMHHKDNKEHKNTEANENKIDKVGETNIHPVSDRDEADDDAKVVAPSRLGDADESDDE